MYGLLGIRSGPLRLKGFSRQICNLIKARATQRRQEVKRRFPSAYLASRPATRKTLTALLTSLFVVSLQHEIWPKNVDLGKHRWTFTAKHDAQS
jgi:hypothetical protein